MLSKGEKSDTWSSKLEQQSHNLIHRFLERTLGHAKHVADWRCKRNQLSFLRRLDFRFLYKNGYYEAFHIPVKLIKRVKIAHSFLQSVSDQFHVIVLSLPM